MTLHTTTDGQITYEGLPVANQEEVKYWIWQESGYLDTIYPEVKPDTDYELPDEEFEAKAETPNWIHDERKVVRILRKPVSDEICIELPNGTKAIFSGTPHYLKPVSEEGEKNFVDQPADIQEALSKGGYWEMLGEGEKKANRTRIAERLKDDTERIVFEGEKNKDVTPVFFGCNNSPMKWIEKDVTQENKELGEAERVEDGKDILLRVAMELKAKFQVQFVDDEKENNVWTAPVSLTPERIQQLDDHSICKIRIEFNP